MLNWKDTFTRNALLGLVLGQFLSLVLASSGFASSELARRGFDAPTSQSFINYVLLMVVYGGIMLYRRQPIKVKWYYYILMGFCDVEGNYLVVKAYQFTSLTSVSLLDYWTLPCVLFLTWLILKTKYGPRKIFGLIICLAGLVAVVFSDVHASDNASGKDPVKGDLMVLAGATLYALSNVTQEFIVKAADWIEMLTFLGIFGAIISACQIAIFERIELQSIHWSSGMEIPFLGYTIAFFLFYSGLSISLKISGSTMFNLSLLTADMWAVLIRIFIYNQKVDWLFFVAFCGVALGLVVYSWEGKSDQSFNDSDEEACFVQGSKAMDSSRSCSGASVDPVESSEATPLIKK